MSNDKTPAQAAAEKQYPDAWIVHDQSIVDHSEYRRAFIKGAEWQASQQRGPSVDMTDEEYRKMLAQLKEGTPVVVPRAQLTVDQIMDVVEDVLDKNDLNDQMLYGKIRSRLTALLDKTPSPR